MATEDLTTYTETDPNSHISVTSSRSTFTAMHRSEDAYVYKDKGVDHFNGDYEHLVTVYFDAYALDGFGVVWALTNVIDDWYAIYNSTDIEHEVTLYRYTGNGGESQLYVRELTASIGGFTDDYGAISMDTLYYLKIKRDEAVGDNGTLYCYIYTDSGRTNLHDTLAIALADKYDFRYIWATQSRNQSESTQTITGYCENFDLQEFKIRIFMHHYKMMAGVS